VWRPKERNHLPPFLPAFSCPPFWVPPPHPLPFMFETLSVAVSPPPFCPAPFIKKACPILQPAPWLDVPQHSPSYFCLSSPPTCPGPGDRSLGWLDGGQDGLSFLPFFFPHPPHDMQPLPWGDHFSMFLDFPAPPPVKFWLAPQTFSPPAPGFPLGGGGKKFRTSLPASTLPPPSWTQSR